MILLSAKPLVETEHARFAERVADVVKRAGRKPKLAVVLVGEDPASVIYTRKKGETALALGMEHVTLKFSAAASPLEVKSAVEKLNADPTVDGILIQRPLPRSFNEEEVLYWVTPSKDVDAFHPETAGRASLGLTGFRSCTPSGVLKLLDHYGIEVAGKIACVIGRSNIVGKPMASLLLQRDATVIQAHSKTPQLSLLTRQAEILVVAAGRPHLIGPEHVRDGAVVVDVGIHRDAQGKIVGDVQYEAVAAKTHAITPVPGGVGPTTILCLMENTILSAEKSC